MIECNCNFLKRETIIPPHNPIGAKLPFYVVNIGKFSCGKNHYNAGEGLPYFYILYTISGSADCTYKNVNLKLSAGTAAFIDCTQKHTYKNNSDQPWEFVKIAISGNTLSTFDFLINGFNMSILEIDKDLILNFYKKIKENLDVNKTSSMIDNSIEITKLLRLFTVISEKDGMTFISELDKVIEFVHLNYKNKITLDTMAEYANISKFHLIRLFKTHLGVTPYKYLMKYRISEAKRLMRTTQKTVTEIAYEVGIPDFGNFSKQFKEDTGFTPHEYKTSSHAKSMLI